MSIFTQQGLSPLNYGVALDWTKNNKFYLNFNTSKVSEEYSKYFEFLRGLSQDLAILNSCIMDVNIFDQVGDPFEQYIGERYVQANGRIQSSQVSIKFRDFSDGYLYKGFIDLFHNTQRAYPDEIGIDIEYYLEPSWKDSNDSKFIVSKDCYIVTISGITLDQASQNQFLEFTVTFKCPKTMKL